MTSYRAKRDQAGTCARPASIAIHRWERVASGSSKPSKIATPPITMTLSERFRSPTNRTSMPRWKRPGAFDHGADSCADTRRDLFRVG